MNQAEIINEPEAAAHLNLSESAIMLTLIALDSGSSPQLRSSARTLLNIIFNNAEAVYESRNRQMGQDDVIEENETSPRSTDDESNLLGNLWILENSVTEDDDEESYVSTLDGDQ